MMDQYKCLYRARQLLYIHDGWMILASILLSYFLAIGCHYNVEEDLIPSQDCDVAEVSYAVDINPIIEVRCLQCHSTALNFGGISLESYEQLKQQVDGGRFLGAVNQEPGFSPMPQNEGQLPECNLAMIQSWINNGAPNN